MQKATRVLYWTKVKSTTACREYVNITWRQRSRPLDFINKEFYKPTKKSFGATRFCHQSFTSYASPHQRYKHINSDHQKLYTGRLIEAVDSGRLVAGDISLDDLRKGLILNSIQIEEAHGDAITHAEESSHLGLSDLTSKEGSEMLSKLDKLEDILGVPYNSMRMKSRLMNEAKELITEKFQKQSVEHDKSIEPDHQKLYTSRLIEVVDNGRLVAGEVSLDDLRKDLILNSAEIEEAHGDAIAHAEESSHLGLSGLTSKKGQEILSKLDKLEDILGVPYDSLGMITRFMSEAGEMLQRKWKQDSIKNEKI